MTLYRFVIGKSVGVWQVAPLGRDEKESKELRAYYAEGPNREVVDLVPASLVADLRSSLEGVEAERDAMLENERGGLHKAVRVAEARAERAEEALKFYADRTNPNDGRRAREALSLPEDSGLGGRNE